jgi:hypothetical protein
MTVSRALSLETWSVVIPYCCVTSIPNSRRGFRRQVLEAEPEILVKPDGVPVNRRVVGLSPTCGAGLVPQVQTLGTASRIQFVAS